MCMCIYISMYIHRDIYTHHLTNIVIKIVCVYVYIYMGLYIHVHMHTHV